jgi:hypothetical protein
VPTPFFALLLVLGGGSAAQPALAALGLVAKCLSDGMLLARLRGRPFALADLGWIPVKDTLALMVWSVGLFRRTVAWRNKRFRVLAGSRLEPARDLRVAPETA